MNITDRITVVTVTLPRRRHLLDEASASVRAQTVLPAAHLIVWDLGDGFVATINRAIESVRTDYFCLLDDDDLLYPHHIATLAQHLDTDIAYTYCDVTGRDVSFNRPYEPGLLQRQPYIPSNHAMRTETFRGLGGYRAMHNADSDLLARAERAGATFQHIPEITWQYRFTGDNISLTGAF